MAPDGSKVSYTYDSFGNLVSARNPATGYSMRYGYQHEDDQHTGPHLLAVAVALGSTIAPIG